MTGARTLIFLSSKFHFHILLISFSRVRFRASTKNVCISSSLSSSSSAPTERACASSLLAMRIVHATARETGPGETCTRLHFLSLPVLFLRPYALRSLPLLSARVTAFFSSHPVVLRAPSVPYAPAAPRQSCSSGIRRSVISAVSDSRNSDASVNQHAAIRRQIDSEKKKCAGKRIRREERRKDEILEKFTGRNESKYKRLRVRRLNFKFQTYFKSLLDCILHLQFFFTNVSI